MTMIMTMMRKTMMMTMTMIMTMMVMMTMMMVRLRRVCLTCTTQLDLMTRQGLSILIFIL